MSRILLLLRYSLKMPKGKGKLQMPTPVRYLLFIVVMLCLSAGYAAAVGEAYGLLQRIGEQTLLIQLVLVSGSMLTLIIGFFNVINTFFLAEDVEVFLPLPFKPSEIVFSKLITTLSYLYVYSIIIILPLVAYGIASNAGWLFYVYVVCAYIFNPIIPMVFAFIVSSLLMKLGNLSKHKDALKVIFTVVLIVLIIGVNVLFKGNDAGRQAAEIVTAKKSVIHVLSLIFINIKLEVSALAGYGKAGGILNILGVFLIVAILICILYFVSEKLYLSSLKESTDNRRKVTKAKKVVAKESSVLKALMIKEFKVIFRTPTFLVNSVVMLFYMPVIYIFLISSSSLTSRYWHFGFIVVGATMFAISLGMSSGSAASTALSREGNNILVSKYIPVSYKTQVLAKIITSFLINSLIIILGIGMLFFEKVSPEIMILSIIIQILTCLFMSVLGVFSDYLNPKLSWQTEKNLYRGNFRNLTNMIVAVVFGGILLAIAFVVKEVLIIFVINVIVLLIAISVILYALNRRLIKVYQRI